MYKNNPVSLSKVCNKRWSNYNKYYVLEFCFFVSSIVRCDIFLFDNNSYFSQHINIHILIKTVLIEKRCIIISNILFRVSLPDVNDNENLLLGLAGNIFKMPTLGLLVEQPWNHLVRKFLIRNYFIMNCS